MKHWKPQAAVAHCCAFIPQCRDVANQNKTTMQSGFQQELKKKGVEANKTSRNYYLFAQIKLFTNFMCSSTQSKTSERSVLGKLLKSTGLIGRLQLPCHPALVSLPRPSGVTGAVRESSRCIGRSGKVSLQN